MLSLSIVIYGGNDIFKNFLSNNEQIGGTHLENQVTPLSKQ